MGISNHVGGIATMKTAVKACAVDTAGAFATTNSVIIDRQDYDSALLKVQLGTVTGAPATVAVDAKLQESADSAMAGATDVTGGAITQLTAVGTAAFVDLPVASARKRYLRVSYKTALTGGATPLAVISAELELGGKVNGKPTHAF